MTQLDRAGKGTIVLVPVGPVSADLLGWLNDQLAQVLGREVTTGERIPLPEDGYDSSRGQYRGEAILDALHTLAYPDAEHVLGLTEADCYAPELNFVFGQAMLNGRDAFVALPRLRSSFYGLPEDVDLFRRRALKECVHELGHTWGLGHCCNSRCVMFFSNSLLDTDAKGVDFCARCHRRLEKGSA